MSSWSASLRDGAWLTSERLRLYPTLLGGALAIAIVALGATGHGALDHWGRPLGIDFSGVWVAGQEVRAGHPAMPYDNAAHAAAQAKAFASDSFLPWPYPPYFLAVAAVLAGLPYLVALAIWQAATLALYLAAVLRAGRGLPRRALLLAALAFPAVAINLWHGQNGFLSAGLLALGALQIGDGQIGDIQIGDINVPRRPLVAGVLLGLLAYKPQFALAVPLALLAGRHWRVLLTAAATVAAMTSMTWLAFGAGPWMGFIASLGFTRRVILEGGGLESWKLQSAFAAVRLLGGPVGLAYAIQGVVALAVLAGLAWLWRGSADMRVKVAGLAVASLLATPYAVDYDLTMVGPALAALAAVGLERGFAPWRKSLLAVAWLMPLLARPAAMLLALPLGLLVMAALFVAVLAEARRSAAVNPAASIFRRPARFS